MSRKMYLRAIVQRSVGVVKKAINASCIRGIHATGASARSMTSCQRSGTVMILSFTVANGPVGRPQGVSDDNFGAVLGSATAKSSGSTVIAAEVGIMISGIADVSYEIRRVFSAGGGFRVPGFDPGP